MNLMRLVIVDDEPLARRRLKRLVAASGMGTIVALMLPYVVVIAVASTIMFVIWYVLGIPLGPGSPVDN